MSRKRRFCAHCAVRCAHSGIWQETDVDAKCAPVLIRLWKYVYGLEKSLAARQLMRLFNCKCFSLLLLFRCMACDEKYLWPRRLSLYNWMRYYICALCERVLVLMRRAHYLAGYMGGGCIGLLAFCGL